MKKIVFLGCENSHAEMFLNFLKGDKEIQTVGVYSRDRLAAERLSERFGVPVMERFDEAAGDVDGAVITARHGGDHLLFCKPYIAKGRAIFVDKPVTVTEEDAVSLMRACKEGGARVCGGSSLRFDDTVMELKRDALSKEGGETIGGYLRCPVSLSNPNGGFFFYARHLIECLTEIFGVPRSVSCMRRGKNLSVNFGYEQYVVTGTFIDEVYTCYYAARMTDGAVKGKQFIVNGENPCFRREWEEYRALLMGETQGADFEAFIRPVFVMNAVYRAMQSGREEAVREVGTI